MLRKLASLFFEEEEEIVEEEEIQSKGPLLPPIANTDVKKTPRVELESAALPIETAPLNPGKEPTPKPATRIDIGPEPTIQKTKRNIVENKAVYEFQPVISPIFGISEKDKRSVDVQNVVPALPPRHSPLQTIISPIYGVLKNNSAANEEFTEVLPSANPNLDFKNFSLDEILHTEAAIKEKTLEQFSLFEDNHES